MYNEEQNISVAEFIIANIDDVLDDFDNKAFERIAKECASLLRNGQNVTFQYFVQHHDESLRRMAVDVSTSPDEYSPNWTDERRNSPLKSQKMPEENFNNDSEHAIKYFRLRRLIRMCEKNQTKIKEYPRDADPMQLMILIKAQQKLIEMRNVMAAEVGMVVLK